MASTSTGYAPALISKEQPSSSGQVMRFSSGCMLAINNDAEAEFESGSTANFESGSVLNVSGKMQVKSGGEVELESGSTMNVESGGFVRFADGSRLRYSSVNETSAANLMLDADGVSVITPTTKWLSTSTGANAYIQAPPAAGIQKTIIVRNTTKIVEIAASTAKARHFCSSSTKGYTLKIQPTTESKRLGCRVDLMSLSSAMWNVSMPAPLMASSGWDGQATVTTSTLN